MPEDGAQLVVADLADEGRAAAEGGQAGDGVGRRAARTLDAGPHVPVQRIGSLGVHQGHGALGQPVAFQEPVVCMGQHVDDGVADSDHVEAGLCHGCSLLGRRGALSIAGTAVRALRNFAWHGEYKNRTSIS